MPLKSLWHVKSQTVLKEGKGKMSSLILWYIMACLETCFAPFLFQIVSLELIKHYSDCCHEHYLGYFIYFNNQLIMFSLGFFMLSTILSSAALLISPSISYRFSMPAICEAKNSGRKKRWETLTMYKNI